VPWGRTTLVHVIHLVPSPRAPAVTLFPQQLAGLRAIAAVVTDEQFKQAGSPSPVMRRLLLDPALKEDLLTCVTVPRPTAARFAAVLLDGALERQADQRSWGGAPIGGPSCCLRGTAGRRIGAPEFVH